MGNTEKILWIIYIGTLVASFLLDTSRVLQATELCQEYLILLNSTAQEQVVELAYTRIYAMLFQAYCLLNDHTSAINCGSKLLDFLRGLGLRVEEGEMTFPLAKLYRLQSKYKEAKELYKKALGIMKETGDRKGETLCYRELDEATKKLMSRFYEHLVRAESASESLHQAMKWMRSNGYSDVCEWMPFMLIGDNVTFDFGK